MKKLDFKRKIQIAVMLTLIVLMQFVLRTPFLAEPLDRDEGAQAYAAQRLVAGERLYQQISASQPPAVYFLYAAVFRVFGSSVAVIRSVALFFSLLSTLAMFFVGFLMFGSLGGLLAAFLFALYSGGPYIDGASVNPENFAVFFVITGYAFYLYSLKRNGSSGYFFCALSGIFFSAAFLFKAIIGLFFLLFLGVMTVSSKKTFYERPRMGYYALGFLSLPVFLSFYYLFTRSLFAFLMSVFVSPLNFIRSPLTPEMLYKTLFLVINENGILWILTVVGMSFVLIKDRKPKQYLMVFFGLLSMLMVFVQGRFMGYNYLLLLPPFALISSYTIVTWRKEPPNLLANIFGFVVLAFLFFTVVYIQYPFYLVYTPQQISEEKSGSFNLTLAGYVGDEIKKNSSKNDTIYVCGPEPEIYFYSQRKSASKYLITQVSDGIKEYGEGKKRQIMQSIVQNQPRYIVWTVPSYYFVDLFAYTVQNYSLAIEVCDWRIYERVDM
ncbi:MAG: glycosyltransferase family 39 protein [Candidatus Margulisiibacteriota bacterium]